MASSISKDDLVHSILILVYHNIYCSDPNDPKWVDIAENGFEKRILGFRAEAEFVRKIFNHDELEIFAGPTLLPNRKNANPTHSPVLFTVDTKPVDNYLELYEKYSTLSSNSFYLRYSVYSRSSSYNLIDLFGDGYTIPVPIFKCYRFCKGQGFEDVTSNDEQGISKLISLFKHKKGKRYLSGYPVSPLVKQRLKSILCNFTDRELNQILAVRAVFDGFLGFNIYRGKPADIDCIIKTESGYSAFEVKEKDLTKTPPFGFGMDTTRASDLISLQEQLNIKFYYVIKHVDNQYERNHVGWKRISMDGFMKHCNDSTVSGGLGMMTAGDDFVETVIVPESEFLSF